MILRPGYRLGFPQLHEAQHSSKSVGEFQRRGTYSLAPIFIFKDVLTVGIHL